MYLGDLFHRLQLQYHQVIHNQIGLEAFIKPLAFPVNWDNHLTSHLKPSTSQLSGQDPLINRFEQPGPQFGVDLEAGVDNNFCNLIFCQG